MRTLYTRCLLAAVVLCTAALWSVCDGGDPKADGAGARLSAHYGSIPKGAVLEGGAEGMEPVERVAYDAEENRFVINGETVYPNPVSREEWATILAAILQDDRIGVSVLSGNRYVVFGDLKKDGAVAKHIVRTDKLICGVTFARAAWVKGVELPGDYQPRPAEQRPAPAVICTIFDGYRFEKEDGVYRRVAGGLTPLIVLVTEETAGAGGFAHDPEATRLKKYAREDTENLAHIQTHMAAYRRIPCIDRVLRYGEAAAFARHLRDSGADLSGLPGGERAKDAGE